MSGLEAALGWDVASGSELFEFVRGVSYKKSSLLTNGTDDSFAILRAGNLQNDRIVLEDLVHIPASGVKQVQELRPGDVVVATSSGSPSIVGKTAAVVDEMPRVSFGAFCAVLRPRNYELAPWLRYYFITRSYRTQIAAKAAGVNINNIRREHLEELQIPIPPMAEQVRIIAEVESLRLRSARARLLLDGTATQVVQLRQSILHSAFNGSLTADWRAENPDVEPTTELLDRIRTERRGRWEDDQLQKFEAKGKKPPKNWKTKYREPEPIDDSDLPELPNGWCWASLDELAEVGSGTTPKRGRDDYWIDGTIPWISSGAVNETEIRKSNDFVTHSAVLDCNLKIYPAGTLLIAMYGEGKTRGKTAELCIPATINQALASIQLKGAAAECLEYVKWAMIDGYARFRIGSEGGVQPNLNAGKVRALAIPLAPLSEQQEIVRGVASGLEAQERVARSAAESLIALNALDQAILAKAFRGELVPQDPNDEPASKLLARIAETAPNP